MLLFVATATVGIANPVLGSIGALGKIVIANPFTILLGNAELGITRYPVLDNVLLAILAYDTPELLVWSLMVLVSLGKFKRVKPVPLYPIATIPLPAATHVDAVPTADPNTPAVMGGNTIHIE